MPNTCQKTLPERIVITDREAIRLIAEDAARLNENWARSATRAIIRYYENRRRESVPSNN